MDRPVHLRPDRGADAQRASSEYQQLRGRACDALAERINAALRAAASYRPIILLAEHHEPHDGVTSYYRAADICFVTQPARRHEPGRKEFVAARDDEQGVLVLSQFAGAARELPEALIVNPYDVEQCADALHAR